jgi:hypothetical protein
MKKSANSNSDFDFGVLDVETTPIRAGEFPRVLFWGFANSKGYFRFDTTRKLLNFLKKCNRHVIFHHTNFDILMLLLENAPVRIYRTHAQRIILSRLFQHTLKNSYALFPAKLENILRLFGKSKTGLHNLDKRNFEDTADALECFLKFDAIFERVLGVSILRSNTLSGAVFRAAQKQVGPMPTETRFLESYRGGRTDVFNTEVHPAVSCFDINSSYPKSVLECEPTETLLELTVDCREFYAPFFDADTTEKLVFPNGKFRTWIFESNLERIRADGLKAKIKIRSRAKLDFAWLYNLKPFIQKLYDLKSNAENDALRECAKLGLNSFYGRIGLKPEFEVCRVLDYKPDFDEVTIFPLGKRRFLCFWNVVKLNTKSNYAFASFITDNARARLFNALRRVNAIYCDTDSVFTLDAGAVSKLDIGPKCGQWACKGQGAFQAFAPKDYVFDNTVRIKGGIEKTQWTLKMLAAGLPPRLITRHRLDATDGKRIPRPDGWTEPILR